MRGVSDFDKTFDGFVDQGRLLMSLLLPSAVAGLKNWRAVAPLPLTCAPIRMPPCLSKKA